MLRGAEQLGLPVRVRVEAWCGGEETECFLVATLGKDLWRGWTGGHGVASYSSQSLLQNNVIFTYNGDWSIMDELMNFVRNIQKARPFPAIFRSLSI